MTLRKYSRPVLFMAIVCTTFGCGGDLVKLRARVTLDGEPLEGATVTLIRVKGEEGRSASGRSDEEGRVRFTTYQPNDGVPPGNYKVCIAKTIRTVGPNPEKIESKEEPAEEPPATYEEYFMQRSAEFASPLTDGVPFAQTLLPRIYLQPTTTPLTCTVPAEEREVVFALDSNPAAPGQEDAVDGGAELSREG